MGTILFSNFSNEFDEVEEMRMKEEDRKRRENMESLVVTPSTTRHNMECTPSFLAPVSSGNYPVSSASQIKQVEKKDSNIEQNVSNKENDNQTENSTTVSSRKSTRKSRFIMDKMDCINDFIREEENSETSGSEIIFQMLGAISDLQKSCHERRLRNENVKVIERCYKHWERAKNEVRGKISELKVKLEEISKIPVEDRNENDDRERTSIENELLGLETALGQAEEYKDNDPDFLNQQMKFAAEKKMKELKNRVIDLEKTVYHSKHNQKMSQYINTYELYLRSAKRNLSRFREEMNTISNNNNNEVETPKNPQGDENTSEKIEILKKKLKKMRSEFSSFGRFMTAQQTVFGIISSTSELEKHFDEDEIREKNISKIQSLEPNYERSKKIYMEDIQKAILLLKECESIRHSLKPNEFIDLEDDIIRRITIGEMYCLKLDKYSRKDLVQHTMREGHRRKVLEWENKIKVCSRVHHSRNKSSGEKNVLDVIQEEEGEGEEEEEEEEEDLETSQAEKEIERIFEISRKLGILNEEGNEDENESKSCNDKKDSNEEEEEKEEGIKEDNSSNIITTSTTTTTTVDDTNLVDSNSSPMELTSEPQQNTDNSSTSTKEEEEDTDGEHIKF